MVLDVSNKQKIQCSGKSLWMMMMYCQVPQGTVLASFLFIIADADKEVTDSICRCFEDNI